MMRFLILAFVSCTIAACTTVAAPRSPHGGSAAAPAAQTLSDTALAIATLLSEIPQLSAAAARAWPGFRIEDQVFILFADGGPTGLVGDPNPPEDFLPVAGSPGVYLLPGPPPDSLTVQGIVAWHGRRAAAVPYPYRPNTIELNGYGYIHEAFHAFQFRVQPEGRFSGDGGSNTMFPDTVVEAVALLNLEGRLLAEALTTREPERAREAALSALAVRDRRCVLLGTRECELERRLEQMEGSATFVEWRVLRDAGYVSAAEVIDTVLQAIRSVEDLTRLERFYFYDRGHALLLLLEHLGVPEWRRQVEQLPPDSVLSLHLGFAPERDKERLKHVLLSEPATLARAHAERAVARIRTVREEIVRDFWAQPGVPVRIYSQSGNVNRQAVRGEARSAAVIVGRRTNHYIVGQEIRWIGRNGEWEAHSTGGIFSFGGGPVSITVKTPLVEQSARVDGRVISLASPGERVQGAIVLTLPNLSLQAAQGEIQAHGDSVSLWVP